jgi:hypothetical protein
MALAQDHLDAYAVCYTKAVDRLYRVIVSRVTAWRENSRFAVDHTARILGNICLLQSTITVATS